MTSIQGQGQDQLASRTRPLPQSCGLQVW